MTRAIDLDPATPGPQPAASRAAGFPIGGENLAVDLADTLVTVTEPPTDLLVDGAACDRFWHVHAGWLPAGSTMPTLEATRRVRDALRRLLDATVRGADVDVADVRLMNATSDAATTSLNLDVRDAYAPAVARWHTDDPSRLPLAAAARSAIAVLTDPAQRAALRRCASPACSMLFVKGDSRRRWCSPDICGNRDRVARHYRRHRNTGA